MKTRQRSRWYLCVGLFLGYLAAVNCYADDRARDRESLCGLKSIMVIVHTFERECAPELAKAGLTENVLQAAIERQLEKSGFQLNRSFFIRIPGSAF